ncbi:DUF1543 domain-containing protein [Sphingobacterium suaedae]|uniref:DUF1543 domain-containing protein n=1 Tax=Sphingobacterium suaedae TaxID=1686402 RepID=A0ABW5KGT2_9SPHI
MSKNLYMVLLGCKPNGRFTEQHDVFFGIGESLTALKKDMEIFWPEANGKLHVDAWRLVSIVEHYRVHVVERMESIVSPQSPKLFFVNLGGYREGEFEEHHYKQLIVARSPEEAASNAKSTSFFKNFISPHIDDRYGLDVDDICVVEDALPHYIRKKYQLLIEPETALVDPNDEFHIGYLKFAQL